MKSLALLLSLLSLLALSQANHWAVIVAGSNGFWNYRHQADVCHAYHVLISKGLSASNIIVFSYDDVANDSNNPFPGKLFNKPTNEKPGVDVYAGCKIDYKGNDVNPTNFLKVLKGDLSGMKGVGTGRVLQSTSADKVFLNFADHGAPGLIAFPNDYLYANDLLAAFQYMHDKKMYKELVFYLEACESGSMFQNLPKNISLFALSAASPDESSWGTYCDPDDVVEGKHIGSCLGDLFSVNWMEDSDAKDLCSETLDSQFKAVKKLTDKSQVMEWGDLTFVNEQAGSFIGVCANNGKEIFLRRNTEQSVPIKANSIDSRDIKYFYLKRKYQKNPTPENLIALQEEELSKHYFDHKFSKLTNALGYNYLLQNSRNFQLPGNLNLDCLKEAISSFENNCRKLSDYALKHVRNFAFICHYSNGNNLTKAIENICNEKPSY